MPRHPQECLPFTLTKPHLSKFWVSIFAIEATAPPLRSTPERPVRHSLQKAKRTPSNGPVKTGDVLGPLLGY